MTKKNMIDGIFTDFREKTLEQIMLYMKEVNAGSFAVKLCSDEDGEVLAGLVILNGDRANEISNKIDFIFDEETDEKLEKL